MPFLAPIVAPIAGALGLGGAGAAAGGLSLGSIFQAGGAILGGISAMAAGNYQAKVAAMNAEIARDNAARAIESSQIEQVEQDAQTSSMIGEQLAAQSSSGLSLGGRSQILSRKNAAELGRKDALNVRYGGEAQKYNFLTEAAGQDASASMYKAQGVGDLLGGFLQAGSIIGSARPSSSARRRFSNTPVPVSRPSVLG